MHWPMCYQCRYLSRLGACTCSLVVSLQSYLSCMFNEGCLFAMLIARQKTASVEMKDAYRYTLLFCSLALLFSQALIYRDIKSYDYMHVYITIQTYI